MLRTLIQRVLVFGLLIISGCDRERVPERQLTQNGTLPRGTERLQESILRAIESSDGWMVVVNVGEGCITPLVFYVDGSDIRFTVREDVRVILNEEFLRICSTSDQVIELDEFGIALKGKRALSNLELSKLLADLSAQVLGRQEEHAHSGIPPSQFCGSLPEDR